MILIGANIYIEFDNCLYTEGSIPNKAFILNELELTVDSYSLNTS